MDIRDENNNQVDIANLETTEQYLANEFIGADDVVLELGARYGSVSCIINSKLNCKNNQVVVEPDERVWEALERNKSVNNCEFHIVKGFISNKKLGLTNKDCCGGYGTTSIQDEDSKIQYFSLDDIKSKYNLNFNVLVADCEGFLEVFFDENPTAYDTLRMVIFEGDYPDKCNYNKIRKELTSRGFTCARELYSGFQNVYVKE